MDIYFDPKITEIIPLVKGTVESHKIPKSEAKILIVISVLGRNIKTKNKIDLSEYSITSKSFLDLLSPRYPNIRVPITLNNPISASDHDPIQRGKDKSSRYAGRCVATKET